MNKKGSFIFILVAIIVLAGAFYLFFGNNSTGAAISKCIDTDEKFGIYLKGNASSVGSGDDGIYIADECIGLTGVKEAYCDGNTATASEKFCPVGFHCNDGACIETSECNDLIDNDGDGTKDYPGDADCTSLDDSAE